MYGFQFRFSKKFGRPVPARGAHCEPNVAARVFSSRDWLRSFPSAQIAADFVEFLSLIELRAGGGLHASTARCQTVTKSSRGFLNRTNICVREHCARDEQNGNHRPRKFGIDLVERTANRNACLS